MMNQSVVLYAQIVASMALWGGTWVAGRVLAETMHPMPAAFLRFSLASIFLLFLCRKSLGHFPRLEKERVLPLLFLGCTGVTLYSWFFFTGLKTAPAGRAALIVACIPVCIAASSALIFKEKFGPLRILGTILSLSGVAVVIADGNPLALLAGGVRPGDLLILGCVASWTAYSLGGKSVMKTLDPLTTVTWSCVFGTLLLLPPALWNGLVEETLAAGPVQWGCLLFLSVLATGLAYYWYYRAIRIIGPSKAGIFINLVPVFAISLGTLILAEPVHLSLLGGGIMVVGGVYITNRA